MKSLSTVEIYNNFKRLTEKYLPLPAYQKMVSEERQQKEIELLKETIHYERFFFVLDLHHWNMHDVHGVEKWLGYSKNEFDLMKWLSIMHPFQAPAYNASASTMIEGAMRGDWKIEFMKHRYVTQIALKHKNGEYLLCKRLASVFQYDNDNRMLEYINEFTVIGKYREEPYAIRVLDDEGGDLIWEAEMMSRIKDSFQNKNLFSFQEIRILRKYAYHPEITTTEIARAFKIQQATVMTYHKRILAKAEQLFNKNFDTTRLIARYMMEQWLL